MTSCFLGRFFAPGCPDRTPPVRRSTGAEDRCVGRTDVDGASQIKEIRPPNSSDPHVQTQKGRFSLDLSPPSRRTRSLSQGCARRAMLSTQVHPRLILDRPTSVRLYRCNSGGPADRSSSPFGLEHRMFATPLPPEQDAPRTAAGKPSTMARVKAVVGRTAFGRVVLRIAGTLVGMEVFDRAMTLAAQAFTSVLPLIIVVAALRRGDAQPIGSGLSQYLGLNSSAASVLQHAVPASSDVFRALGWFGILLLVVSATAYSRALERFYSRVWSIPKPGFRAVWRPFAVLATVLLGLVLLQFTRSVLRADGTFVVLTGIVEFVLWTIVWLVAGWVVLNRAISFRSLFPGALLCGLGLAIAGGVGRIYLPISLTSAARQFGVLGITIAYVGWIFVLMSVVVIAVTVGKVLSVDYGVMRRRPASPARD